MKQIILIAALLGCATQSQAACYAEYKAKQDNPLKLHYGVMQLSDGACSDQEAATNVLKVRLGGAGWTLLNLLSLSTDTPTQQQETNAGDFFLRF